MITLLGVGHVFDITAQVRDVVMAIHPGVVAVELDKYRYEALRNGTPKGNMPLTYKLMARFQERMAGKFGGGDVGKEMLAAVDAAREIRAGVAFIDVTMQVVQKFIGGMGRKEKLKLFMGGVGGQFVSKKRVEKELEKFNESPEEYMELFEEHLPGLKKALVDDRNMFMARNIRMLSDKEHDVLAVVGDAHVAGMQILLEGTDGDKPEKRVASQKGNVVAKPEKRIARQEGEMADQEGVERGSSMPKIGDANRRGGTITKSEIGDAGLGRLGQKVRVIRLSELRAGTHPKPDHTRDTAANTANGTATDGGVSFSFQTEWTDNGSLY